MEALAGIERHAMDKYNLPDICKSCTGPKYQSVEGPGGTMTYGKVCGMGYCWIEDAEWRKMGRTMGTVNISNEELEQAKIDCGGGHKAPNPDMVNHPPHYMLADGLEAIDVIAAATKDLNGMEAVDTACALKYTIRWKKKNGVEDIEKAVWYLNDLIKRLKGKNHE